MGMTETQLVLKLLCDEGTCTMNDMVSHTGISASRVIAALGMLQRSGDALKDPRPSGTCYHPTVAGRRKVASWETPAPRGAWRG